MSSRLKIYEARMYHFKSLGCFLENFLLKAVII